MQSLINNARSFAAQVAHTKAELHHLAAGQTPEVLFITCSDSRVIPSLITGAAPGELFELRTAGNIIPQYQPRHPSSEAATIEYAIEVLGVSDVVICGHSHCGAVGAMLRGEDLSAVPAVRAWLTSTIDLLTLRASTASSVLDTSAPTTSAPDISDAVQRHVLTQLDRLREYHTVARKLEKNELRLHGWYYEVHTGNVLTQQSTSHGFLPL